MTKRVLVTIGGDESSGSVDGAFAEDFERVFVFANNFGNFQSKRRVKRGSAEPKTQIDWCRFLLGLRILGISLKQLHGIFNRGRGRTMKNGNVNIASSIVHGTIPPYTECATKVCPYFTAKDGYVTDMV